jgi:inorganic triphosphatase YgiF
MNMKNIIEKEYRFLIPRESLAIVPPKEIKGFFALISNNVIKHRDYLFEREKVSLKSEDIGFRVREIGNKLEFTYKKFLGRENGIVHFDEFTTNISDEDLQRFQSGDFSKSGIDILETLEKKGKLYPLLNIANKRTVYKYEKGECIVELMLEDVVYSSGKKVVADSAMEVEVEYITNKERLITSFINEIRKLYKCEELNEGKNARGERLLGLKLR